MARRKSTIGHDPLQAISLEAPSRPAAGPARPSRGASRAKPVEPKAPPKRPAEPGPMARLLWVVPVVGPLVGLFTMPAVATASCWATGQVFIRHFESGGTVHDFDPARASAHYSSQLAAAKGAA